MSILKRISLLAIAWLLLLSFGQAQKFTASVNKKQVAVNENFQILFRVDNGQGQIKYPDFGDIKLLGGPNTSSSMQFVNGQVTQSITYSFYARLPKEGTYTIEKATVVINGKTFSTEPVTIKAVKGGANTAASGNKQGNTKSKQQGGQANETIMKQIADNLFLRAYLSKKNVYQGEQFTLTYKIYTRLNGLNISDFEAPKFNGFWIEEVNTDEAQLKPDVLNGVQYRSAVFKQYILFPQRSGSLEIDPFSIKANVRVSVGGNSRDPFDAFFNRYRDVPYEFASAPVKMQVNSLPAAGRPANFDGAVGRYTMKVGLDRDSTETGDPVTLKIRIAGDGNIKMVDRLRLEFPPDFEVYDPKVNQKVSNAGGRVSGNKSFDYLIIPRNPGTYKLPVVSFSYFDPEAGRYQSLSSDEFTLIADGEAQGEAMRVTNINKEEVELIGEDIRYIRAGKVELKEHGYTFFGTPGFWSLSILPLLMFGGLFYYRRQQEASAADVVGTRMRKATGVAKKRLAAAQKFQSENNEKAFYDEVSKAVWGYLSDKLVISQADLSRERVGAGLATYNIPAEVTDRLNKLLDTCEMALFAPSAAPGGMAETYNQALLIVTDIEKELKK